MDFPAILAQDGIHGTATLDLYFDHNVQIDESRSRRAISSKLSSDYKIKFEALKDRLEQFDNSGLSGLNQSIDRST